MIVRHPALTDLMVKIVDHDQRVNLLCNKIDRDHRVCDAASVNLSTIIFSTSMSEYTEHS